jgi:hypothetical protein
MRRRLNMREMAGTNPFIKEDGRHEPFVWRVHHEYEVVEEGVEFPYRRVRKSGDASLASKDERYTRDENLEKAARETHDTAGPTLRDVIARIVESYETRELRSYHPLTDTPRLFLSFARIAEDADPGEALERWIARYGLLGLSTDLVGDRIDWVEYPEVVVPPDSYYDTGGPGETLAAVWREMVLANHALNLYEAALDKDVATLDRFWNDTEELRALDKELWPNETSTERTTRLTELALSHVARFVRSRLDVFARPTVYVLDEGSHTVPLTPDRVVASLSPRNLLGAMYLQFSWLITAFGELGRCKYCGELLFPDAPPMHQEGDKRKRRRRSDRVYCDEHCQQKYHYHYRVKPRHQESGTS